MKELRRIQKTGGATYIISLPKRWIKQQGLNVGDIIAIEPLPDGNLILSPYRFEETKIHREAVLEANPKESVDVLIRNFVAYYLVGYDSIKVLFKEGMRQHKEALKNFVREKLIGAEVIEESAKHVLIQCIVRYNELPLKKTLERMSVLAEFMIDDAIRAFIDFDKDLAEEVIRRDNDVDRFYLYAVRQLKQLISNVRAKLPEEIKRPREFLGYRIVVKSIERVADHAARIASSANRLEKCISEDLGKIFLSLSRNVRAIFREAVTSFLERDLSSSHRVINKSVEFSRKCESLLLKILSNADARTAAMLSLVLDSIKRIADYSADIAEIALNLSIETLRKISQ